MIAEKKKIPFSNKDHSNFFSQRIQLILPRELKEYPPQLYGRYSFRQRYPVRFVEQIVLNDL
jgi:hypothetical protein